MAGREWPDKRTVMDVLVERESAVLGGCCDYFAEQKTCPCLSDAMRREGIHHGGYCNRCGAMSAAGPYCSWCVKLAAETRRAGGKGIPPLWKKERPGLRIGASDKATQDNEKPEDK